MNNTIMTIVDTAKKYIERGLSVIPISKDKTPLIPWKQYQERRATAEEVNAWFSAYPDANIAIVTGQISGLAVIDFDTLEAFDNARSKGLPSTPLVQTARGIHAYFQCQDGMRNFQKRADLVGVDFRGEGGYVVAPPSVHQNGHAYKWLNSCSLEDLPLAELPDWVLAKDESEKTPLKDIYQGVDKGQRNMSLARIVGSLANDGLTFEECLATALTVNQKFNPPMSEVEVRSCTRSIIDKHQREKSKSVDTVDARDGIDSVIPEVKFDLFVFPQPLAELIKKIAESFSINVEPVAVTMLSILSSAIGNSVRISPKESWKEPPFIWAMITGPSGTGKTPFVSRLLKIVHELQGRARKALPKGTGSSFDKTVNLDLQPKYFISDTTIEALSETMVECPRGVLSFTDELAGFIKTHDRYTKGNARQKYLELWGCLPWQIDRVSRGSIYIKDTGLSICGGIQLSIVPYIFGKMSIDDGLLPRFLFTSVKDNLKYSQTSIDDTEMKIWDDLVLKCYQIPLQKNAQDEVVHDVLKLSDDAILVFNKFMTKYKKIAHYSSDDSFKVFIPKLTNYVLRIAGVLHVISRENDTQMIISLDTINNSVKLAEYFAHEAVKVLNSYNQSKGPQESSFNEIQIRLLKVLRNLSSEVKKGRLQLTLILDEFNDHCPVSIKQDAQNIAYLLKGLDLDTTQSGGYSYLIWEPEKIKKLLSQLNRLQGL